MKKGCGNCFENDNDCHRWVIGQKHCNQWRPDYKTLEAQNKELFELIETMKLFMSCSCDECLGFDLDEEIKKIKGE